MMSENEDKIVDKPVNNRPDLIIYQFRTDSSKLARILSISFNQKSFLLYFFNKIEIKRGDLPYFR